MASLSGVSLGGGGGGSAAATATFLWELVCDIDFTLEDPQVLSGGNLTVTNRVDGSPVVLAGQAVAIVSGALVMTAATSSNLGVSSASVRTAALLGAAMTTLWPDFDGQPIRWGAEVTAAPTFDSSNRVWGVFAENAAGIGGGSLGHGYSAEVKGTGLGGATRQSRTQADGSTSTATVSSTDYTTGLVCGVGLDGSGPVGLWSTTAGDAGELDVLTAVGAVGAAGASSGGSPVQGVSRLGVFAAGSFVVNIKRLVLWARVARVA